MHDGLRRSRARCAQRVGLRHDVSLGHRYCRNCAPAPPGRRGQCPPRAETRAAIRTSTRENVEPNPRVLGMCTAKLTPDERTARPAKKRTNATDTKTRWRSGVEGRPTLPCLPRCGGLPARFRGRVRFLRHATVPVAADEWRLAPSSSFAGPAGRRRPARSRIQPGGRGLKHLSIHSGAAWGKMNPCFVRVRRAEKSTPGTRRRVEPCRASPGC
jgi:hypothetical protein